jgi:hypothetical protein
MQPPTTSYPHGYNDTSMEAVPVPNPPFYCPSRNGGENMSLYTPCRALFRHWSPSRQNTTSVVPQNSRGSALSIPHRPTLTRPRPTAGQQKSKTCMPQDPGSFHRLILYVTVVSGDGRLFSEHVATTASTVLDKTSLLRHLPASLPPLDPIKGKTGDSTKGGRTRQNKSSLHRRRSTSQVISFVPSLWDLGSAPSLTACNRYAST